jgi:hypothetical protein
MGVRRIYAFDGAPPVNGAMRLGQWKRSNHSVKLRWTPELEEGDITMPRLPAGPRECVRPAAESSTASQQWQARILAGPHRLGATLAGSPRVAGRRAVASRIARISWACTLQLHNATLATRRVGRKDLVLR